MIHNPEATLKPALVEHVWAVYLGMYGAHVISHNLGNWP